MVRARRRSFCITVSQNGKVEVRVPYYASERAAREFVNSKSEWVEKCLKKNADSFFPPKTESGAEFFIAGRPYTLYFYSGGKPVLSDKNYLYVKISAAREIDVEREKSKAFFKSAAEIFLPYAEKRTREIADFLGYEYKSVRVGYAKTRWGSCGGDNSIIFSVYLGLLPQDLIDYVILHELTHTKVKNHGRDFWLLVCNVMPDAKEKREKLKKYAPFLSI